MEINEQACERVRMGLAELGWFPEAVELTINTTTGDPDIIVYWADGDVPPLAVRWKSGQLAGIGTICWPCYQAAANMDDVRGLACYSGNCMAGPDEPKEPARNELISRPNPGQKEIPPH